MDKKIVLSADIIASTSLSDGEKSILQAGLQELLQLIENKFVVFARIIKGDYLEMVIENPEDGLTIMLAIKSFVKTIVINDDNERNYRFKSFKNHGIRIAMGFGELSRYDKINGVIDGAAIYFSGRKISEERTTYNRERIVIKNTLFFVSDDERLNESLNVQLGLIDVLIGNSTAKQCKVLFYKLMGLTEDGIAKKLDVKQPSINKHSTSLGWNAIEKSIYYFKLVIKNHYLCSNS